VLVFLSGEREIREASDFLARQAFRHTEVLPLFGRLSASEQHRVFHPGPERRIILATNIAETSLTVPRIRFVIDSGLVRISRYAHRSRIQRLPIEPVSQASANQRAGRCGRLGPGICVRLYSETEFEARPEFTEPEILRTSLATVVLQMLCMGLGNVEDFPFLDPPAPRMINDAYHLLFELGALNESRAVTSLGRRLARWPMDVRLGRMVLAAERLGCIENVMVLAAALSIQDPRERPLDKQQQADQSHARFDDPKSDFAALLRLWRYLRKQRSKRSGNQFRKLCRREFLNWQRVLEWFDLYQQLRVQAREEGMKLAGRSIGDKGIDAPVHKALLSGLLSQVGCKLPESHAYQGARSRQFHIFPGSGLFKSGPQWLMSAEIVETSRPYARLNAAIQREWLEEQAAHLVKRRYFDPHWSRRAGRVMAWEQVTLYGLVVVEKRRVSFADKEREKAREIFILHALVRGEFDTRASFMQRNEELRKEVEKLEHKRRRHDVMADERAQFDFFDAMIPPKVNSARSFERWFRGLQPKQRESLVLGMDVLMRVDAGMAPEEQFPDYLEVSGQRFPLVYQFEPGHHADGVTITVPLEFLNTLDEGELAWLVPGLRRDKVIAMIKQLPKPLRRALTPAPQFADAATESLAGVASGSFSEALSKAFSRITGESIDAGLFSDSGVEDHLRMRICVVDDAGSELGSGRDLGALKEKLGESARRRFMDRQGADHNHDDAQEWVFGTLEESVTTDAGITAWPALVDQGDAVGVRLYDTFEEAWVAHQEGVVRLLMLELPDKLHYLEKHHGIGRTALMSWSVIGSTDGLVQDLVHSSLRQVAGDVSGVRSEEDFRKLSDKVRQELGGACAARARLLSEVLESVAVARKQLEALESRLPEPFEDMEAQICDLVYEGFLEDLEPVRLNHYPRYLKAILHRLEKLQADPRQDIVKMERVKPWFGHYQAFIHEGGIYDHNLDAFRWLIEEYRVSVFAQHLGTDGKVSETRLAQAWKTVNQA
jgi:ATP-dependent helicase HrpA